MVLNTAYLQFYRPNLLQLLIVARRTPKCGIMDLRMIESSLERRLFPSHDGKVLGPGGICPDEVSAGENGVHPQNGSLGFRFIIL